MSGRTETVPVSTTPAYLWIYTTDNFAFYFILKKLSSSRLRKFIYLSSFFYSLDDALSRTLIDLWARVTLSEYKPS